MPQRTILWDFNGTLANRTGLMSGCLAEVLQAKEPEAGFTRDDVRPFLRDRFPWHEPDVAHPHLCSPRAWWGVIEELLFQACQQLALPNDKARRYARETHQRYIDVAGFTLFDDTVPVLTSLKQQAWRHIILSNDVPELRDIVQGLQLAELVDDVLSSAVTGYEKPNRRAFDLAREVAGNPDELWMVGDNPVADVRGAEAAGIPAILVRTEDASVARCARNLYEVETHLAMAPP